MERKEHVQQVRLSDVDSSDPLVSYSDGEIAFLDTLRDVPGTSAVQADAYIIGHCLCGHLRFGMGDEQVEVRAGQVVICPPHVLVHDAVGSEDFSIKAMFISDRLVRSLLFKQLDHWNRAIFVHKRRVLTLPAMNRQAAVGYFNLAQYILRERSGALQREITTSFFQTMLLEFCALLTDTQEADSAETSAGQGAVRLFDRFLEFLSSGGIVRRSVAECAGQLYVTPKYLSAVCKLQSGRSASAWIQDYVTQDLRYCLRSTNMSMKEIAVRLGFPSTSFLGKYCRRTLGMSPKAYRAASK